MKEGSFEYNMIYLTVYSAHINSNYNKNYELLRQGFS